MVLKIENKPTNYGMGSYMHKKQPPYGKVQWKEVKKEYLKLYTEAVKSIIRGCLNVKLDTNKTLMEI